MLNYESVLATKASDVLNKDNNYYKTTKDSFIFSFADRNNLQTVIVSYPKENHQYFSVYGHSSYGPIFGMYSLLFKLLSHKLRNFRNIYLLGKFLVIVSSMLGDWT